MERIKKQTRMIRIYLSYFKIKFLNEIQYKVAAIAGSCTQFVWAGMYIMLKTNDNIYMVATSILCVL